MSARNISRVLILAAAVGGTIAPALGETKNPGEYTLEGKVFGLPEAQVLDENYTGPPVVGDYVTALPFLKKLDYTGNRTHEVRLDTFAQEIEVAPGKRFVAWTYGGTAPGPVLHVREGDRVIFTMRNRSDQEVMVTEPSKAGAPFYAQLAKNAYQKGKPAKSPMPHSMDFHSGTVAANDKWRTIAPGQSIRFEWVANYPGVYMYHCGTPSVLMHVSMGQYGAVIVSPKEGYPTKADREYVIVQSEYYLAAAGAGGLMRYDHQAAMARNPAVVAFNGHVSALHSAPLEANAGERVRLYVLNAGPSGTSSFHVIGAIFDRVWFEGNLANEFRGMQTVLLGASNGAVVEFIVPEEGSYKLVDHEFADAERGASGTLKAGPRK